MKKVENMQNELREPGNFSAMTTPHENRFATRKDKKK